MADPTYDEDGEAHCPECVEPLHRGLEDVLLYEDCGIAYR